LLEIEVTHEAEAKKFPTRLKFKYFPPTTTNYVTINVYFTMSSEVIDKIAEDQEDGQETSMTEAPHTNKPKEKQPKGHEIATKTIKTPPFSYIYLELISDSTSNITLDEITVRSHVTAALTQFLGLAGSAISMDILKVEGMECWLRVPREDLSPVLAAVGGWVGGNDDDGKVGWRVKAKGNWLSSLVGSQGVEKIWND